jgi:glycosyltransferase involved in cell wall biosynthesis
MRFSIITPSYRQSDWLRLCVASVADQGVEHEHIVQDCCSDDGTETWLPQDPRVKAFVEKDRGMYDAVNRGFRRASGDILAYLNCDEQYLPDALPRVWEHFRSHPQTEVAFAHAVAVDSEGGYLCDRRSLVPTRYHSWVSGSLSILTAATFFRRTLVERRQPLFNPELRVIGDIYWVLRLIDDRVSMGEIDLFTSAFTYTGSCLSRGEHATREKRELVIAAPAWARMARPLIVAAYRVRRWVAGYYRRLPPYCYAIYTRRSPDQRTTFDVTRPTSRWKP